MEAVDAVSEWVSELDRHCGPSSSYKYTDITIAWLRFLWYLCFSGHRDRAHL